MFAFLWQLTDDQRPSTDDRRLDNDNVILSPYFPPPSPPNPPGFSPIGNVVFVQCSFYYGWVLPRQASLLAAAPQKKKKKKKKEKIQCAPAKANKTLSFGEALRFHRLALRVCGCVVVCVSARVCVRIFVCVMKRFGNTHKHTHLQLVYFRLVFPFFALCQLFP